VAIINKMRAKKKLYRRKRENYYTEEDVVEKY
jgi:hypothetical protein